MRSMMSMAASPLACMPICQPDVSFAGGGVKLLLAAHQNAVIVGRFRRNPGTVWMLFAAWTLWRAVAGEQIRTACPEKPSLAARSTSSNWKISCDHPPAPQKIARSTTYTLALADPLV